MPKSVMEDFAFRFFRKDMAAFADIHPHMFANTSGRCIREDNQHPPPVGTCGIGKKEYYWTAGLYRTSLAQRWLVWVHHNPLISQTFAIKIIIIK